MLLARRRPRYCCASLGLTSPHQVCLGNERRREDEGRICRCRKLYALWPCVAGRQGDSASPYPALSSGARCGDGVLRIVDNVMACGKLGYRSRPIAAAWHKAGIVCCCPTLLNITLEVGGICPLCLSMEPRVLMDGDGGRGELRSKRRVEMRYGKRRFGQRVYSRYQERF